MKQKHFVLLITLLLLAVCFIPVLHTSLYSDDISNFQSANAYADKSELNVWQSFKTDFAAILHSGRFTPVTILLQSWAFIQFDTVAAYKQYQFAIALLAAVSFLIYLRSLSLGINTAVWAIFYIAAVQYRAYYHDPAISLHGMYPFIAINVFASLAAYSYFIKRGNVWLLALSVLFYIIAHLSSEVGLIVALLLPLTAWVLRVPFVRFIKTYWIFALITLAYIIYLVWLRGHSDIQYSGLQSNTEPGAMADVFFKQVYGALPLSGLHNQRAVLLIIWHQLVELRVIVAGIAIIALSAVTFFKARYSEESLKSGFINYRFFVLAIAIVLGPAIFITPSVKYQRELHWGMAYLPVFLQCLGVAALLAYIHYALSVSQIPALRAFSRLFFVVGVACAIITTAFNNAVTDKASYGRGKPAEAMDAAVKTGILEPCKDGSTILLTRDFVWRAPDFYARIFLRITGKQFDVYDYEMWHPRTDSSKKEACYVLDCQPGNPIVTTLYELDCYTGKWGRVLKQHAVPCNIQLSAEQKDIYYGI